MANSYNGWPASRDPSAIGVNTRWEPIPGHKFPGGIKSGDVETVFTYLVRQLDARVEPIEEYPAGDEWGFSFRANVNDPNSLSCHASATAIDYNATQHPNRVKYTWTQAQTREIHKILDECSGVIRWLEGWDEMHFEIRGSAAQVAAAAKKIREMAKPVPEPDPEEEEEDDMVVSYAWFKDPSVPGTAANAGAHLYVLTGALATVTTIPAYEWADDVMMYVSGGKKHAPKWNTRSTPFMVGSPQFANTCFLDGPLKGK